MKQVRFKLCGAMLISATAAWAEDPIPPTTPLETFRDCTACPEMVVMPPGSFMMGATDEESRNPFDFYGENASLTKRAPGELNIIPSEHPRHPVEMDIPYAIARTETTLAEWMACVDAGGCAHVPNKRIVMPGPNGEIGPMHPVVDVSYLDMVEYVAWLNAQVGAEVYRLPTEAEWEYAARADSKTRYAQGDDLTADQANFSRKATEDILGVERPDLISRYMPVEEDELDAVNVWGLRHMSGNVEEVTLSCWSETHLGHPTDSAYLANALSQEHCPRRVAKGGSFGTSVDGLRPAALTRPTEDFRRDHIGFRVVRELNEKRG